MILTDRFSGKAGSGVSVRGRSADPLDNADTVPGWQLKPCYCKPQTTGEKTVAGQNPTMSLTGL
jgi:hypothetical protein